MKEKILDYEKLVYSIARKYAFNNDIEDMYQIGMLALQQATDNFDSSYNIKFSTYAYRYVQGEIFKYLRENKLVKVSNDLIRLNSLINKSKEALIQIHQKEPSIKELSDFLEVDENLIMDAIMSGEYVRSLDYALNDEGKELNLYDSIQYEEKSYNENILDLRKEISNLDEDERKIINLRYYQDKTQQETSEELGMSQVQVSRNEKKILVKLNNRLTA